MLAATLAKTIKRGEMYDKRPARHRNRLVVEKS